MLSWLELVIHSFTPTLIHSFYEPPGIRDPSETEPLAQLLDISESGQVLAPLWLAAGHQLIFLSLL